MTGKYIWFIYNWGVYVYLVYDRGVYLVYNWGVYLVYDREVYLVYDREVYLDMTAKYI